MLLVRWREVIRHLALVNTKKETDFVGQDEERKGMVPPI